MANTKLFNIKLSFDQHKNFKKYAEKRNLSMGGILSNYIDELLSGKIEEPVGYETPQKRVERVDPLEHIRGQYKRGIDF